MAQVTDAVTSEVVEVLDQPDPPYVLKVNIPNLPDVNNIKDPQLRAFCIAVKTTLEILTGSHESSNDILVNIINQEKNS